MRAVLPLLANEHPPPLMGAVSMEVTSLDGVVHRVSDAVIAGSNTGRYQADCGTTFLPTAMTEPDATDYCPLCHARQPPRRRRGGRKPRWPSHP